jgi:outer membrane protein assembly factor BamB
MALAVLPVVAVLLIDTHSIAGFYHFFPTPGSDNKIEINTAPQSSASHSSVLAAAFGFQAAESSIITVRTYDGPTGAILSEDSFDVNIKEERGVEHDVNKGRIFAGGIGTDAEGQARFMLRVYDAETGRFLWEGQLNLLKTGEGGMTKAQITARSNDPTKIRTLSDKQAPFQILFSLRAVNPTTGALLWQDQFAPGSSRERRKGSVVGFEMPAMRPTDQPVERIFDLSVRAYDRTSETLLWEDSFQQLDRLEDPAEKPSSDAYPQAIPSWSPSAMGNDKSHRMAWR